MVGVSIFDAERKIQVGPIAAPLRCCEHHEPDSQQIEAWIFAVPCCERKGGSSVLTGRTDSRIWLLRFVERPVGFNVYSHPYSPSETWDAWYVSTKQSGFRFREREKNDRTENAPGGRFFFSFLSLGRFRSFVQAPRDSSMSHVANYQAINTHGLTYSGDDSQTTPLGLKADDFSDEEVSESRQRNTRYVSC